MDSCSEVAVRGLVMDGPELDWLPEVENSAVAYQLPKVTAVLVRDTEALYHVVRLYLKLEG